MIMVDPTKCVACGNCARVCPVFIPSVKNGALHLREGAPCLRCMQCVSVCPQHALHAEGVPEELERIPLSPVEPGDAQALERLVQTRRSIRRFEDRPVDEKLLRAGIELTAWCASAKNNHWHRWSVINSREAMEKLAQVCRAHSEKLEYAPEVYKQYIRGTDLISRGGQTAVICWTEREHYSAQDISIAAATAELYWVSKGLGTMWSGHIMGALRDFADARAAAGMPEGAVCHAALLVGHSAMPRYRSVVWRPKPDIRIL